MEGSTFLDYSGLGNWTCKDCFEKDSKNNLCMTWPQAHGLKYCPWCGRPIVNWIDKDIGFYLKDKE